MREQYFTKARTNAQVDKITVTTDLNETNLSAYLSGVKDVVVHTTGTVRISSPISGTKTGIFFIDGDLEIQSNIAYGTSSTGLVFVVNGDIKINRLTSTINAVLMADGIIYSTWDYIDASRNTQPRIGAPQPLIVNGSIISLDSNATQKIRFNRTLSDNSVSAERVLYQPKYLIILKGLMTDTITFQKEVTVSNFATPFPSAPPLGPGGTPLPSASTGPCPAPGNQSISSILVIDTCVISI